jgi:predicted CoA-binding protein
VKRTLNTVDVAENINASKPHQPKLEIRSLIRVILVQLYYLDIENRLHTTFTYVQHQDLSLTACYIVSRHSVDINRIAMSKLICEIKSVRYDIAKKTKGESVTKERVVILGASDKEDRYSFKALKLLEKYGHVPVPVHPKLAKIGKYQCFESLGKVIESGQKIDTLTLYVRPEISSEASLAIIKLNPGRVIFNPGTENPQLQEELESAGIKYEEACTLVLLNTNQFEH